MLVLLVRST